MSQENNQEQKPDIAVVTITDEKTGSQTTNLVNLDKLHDKKSTSEEIITEVPEGIKFYVPMPIKLIKIF